jgi:hypothetical protein
MFVFGIQPQTGPSSGNTVITITGFNFTSASTVTVGFDSCATLAFVSSTTLLCTTKPSSNTLAQPVKVADQGFHSFSPVHFTFQPGPTITQVLPLSAETGSSFQLTLQGSHWSAGATVRVGQLPCTPVQIENRQNVGSTLSCTVQVPEVHPLGTFDVVLTRVDGQTVTRAGAVTFMAPPPMSITGIIPERGHVEGDTLVFISGSGFKPSAQVQVGERPCAYSTISKELIACVTSPSKSEGRVSISVQNPSQERVTLADSFEYSSDGNSVSLDHASQQHVFDETLEIYAARVISATSGLTYDTFSYVMKVTLAERLLNGFHFYKGYLLPEIVEGLTVKKPIVAFSNLSQEEIDRAKRNYLASPESQAVPFSDLQSHFDNTFPRGFFYGRDILPSDDPLYLSPSDLVDFSVTGPDGLPTRLSMNDSSAIRRAESGIKVAVSYAQNGYGRYNDGGSNMESGWLLDLRYKLKKILVDLRSNPDPSRIILAIRVMASVGQHCGVGNQYGLSILQELMFPGEKESGAPPQHPKDFVLSALDALREQIFDLTSSFEQDDQTGHTKLYYRKLTHQALSIAPGPDNDRYNVALKLLTEPQFLDRFFQGKAGNPHAATEEERRSHKGYTPISILRATIDLMQSNPGLVSDTKDEFIRALREDEVRSWARDHAREILVSIHFEPEEKDEDNRLAMDDLSAEELRRVFASKYFRDGHVTAAGFREILIRYGVLQ